MSSGATPPRATCFPVIKLQAVTVDRGGHGGPRRSWCQPETGGVTSQLRHDTDRDQGSCFPIIKLPEVNSACSVFGAGQRSGPARRQTVTAACSELRVPSASLPYCSGLPPRPPSASGSRGAPRHGRGRSEPGSPARPGGSTREYRLSPQCRAVANEQRKPSRKCLAITTRPADCSSRLSQMSWGNPLP